MNLIPRIVYNYLELANVETKIFYFIYYFNLANFWYIFKIYYLILNIKIGMDTFQKLCFACI